MKLNLNKVPSGIKKESDQSQSHILLHRKKSKWKNQQQDRSQNEQLLIPRLIRSQHTAQKYSTLTSKHSLTGSTSNLYKLFITDALNRWTNIYTKTIK